jgi:UDP-N-acetylmuramoyl-tripeptide--D-alanyl-D-alanine ligase
MSTIIANEICEAAGGSMLSGNLTDQFTGVSTDSRTIGEGEVFFALRGERFDGHDFLGNALRCGKGAVVSNASIRPMEGKTIILVGDTLKALQDMARSRRMGKEVTIIGITGTNGKTTTKEMIASVLNVNHKAAKNPGNLNNHIGLPLSLLEMGEEEFGVFEMGASMKGDIQELCEIALPDIGVVTNIGMGHLASFGSIEAVRSTKLELLSSVRIALVNADDLFLMEGVLEATMRSGAPRIVTFGIENEADVIAKDISSENGRWLFTIFFGDGGSIPVVMNVPGKFNISNALAAAAVADTIGIASEDIRRGIEAFHGIPMRFEFKEFLGATVICDAYNANPASMDGALKELAQMKKKRAVAVLGDMLDLGHYAEDAHRRLGRTMAGLHVDLFIAVGPMMSMAAEEFSSAGGRTIMARDAYEAGEMLRNSCSAGDVILLKGSRGMGMERVLEMTYRESVVQSGGGG